MFKKILASVLIAVSSIASAQIAAVAKGDDGARVELWKDQRICVGDARYAVYRHKATTIEGCWLSNGPAIRIVFLDGDVLVIPVQAFEQPDEV